MVRHLMALTLLLLVSQAQAVEVKLTPDKDFVEVIHQGKLVKIERIQDQDHTLQGGFAKTSRKCPPFCIQPMAAAEGVTTIGQTGIILDARTPAWWKRGTIPGSINIPFTVFTKDSEDLELIEAMERLGAKKRDEVGGFTRTIEQIGLMGGDLKNDTWDFTNAKKLVLWCNGMWCGQSPRAIKGLLDQGYPAKKLFYYRGGMQAWQSLGLTVTLPEE